MRHSEAGPTSGPISAPVPIRRISGDPPMRFRRLSVVLPTYLRFVYDAFPMCFRHLCDAFPTGSYSQANIPGYGTCHRTQKMSKSEASAGDDLRQGIRYYILTIGEYSRQLGQSTIRHHACP